MPNSQAPEIPPKYQIRIDELDRYSWRALLVDMAKLPEPTAATTIMEKSLPALMAKVLIAVCLHDKNLGVPEGEVPISKNGDAKPIILTPNKRIISPN